MTTVVWHREILIISSFGKPPPTIPMAPISKMDTSLRSVPTANRIGHPI
jgi:hypothetical protein